MPAIQSSEIIIHPAVDTTQTNSAGGRMNKAITLVSNTIGNVFPDVEESQRLDGLVGVNAMRAKLFANIENQDNKTYRDATVFMGNASNFNYVQSIIKGDFSNVWADVGAGRKYGTGLLYDAPTYNSVTNTTSIRVATRGVGYGHFATGDRIAITDKSLTTDNTGHLEFKQVTAVSWNGDVAILTVSEPLRYSYATQRTLNAVTVYTRVASCATFGNVACTFAVTSNTSAHGTYDITKLSPRNKGAITQIITITFDSTTVFQAASNIEGIEIIGGNKNNIWEPTDNSGEAFLMIAPEFWTNDGAGNWAAGDSIQIHTNPCALPFFLTLDVPAGAEPSELELAQFWINGYSGSA
ncbi:MAG: hypothetical protein BWK78_00445 [Thiotrichaceae bacterium IS1]|nr:MAG: hypothetical protein BWK78_00445 [Thiotrichaceae bacterium IS1]